MPKLINVGTMRKTDLNAILKAFPEDKVKITVGTIMIKVTRKDNDEEIMSAALMQPFWHVRAIPGLIEKRYL